MAFPVIGGSQVSTYQISNSLRFNDGDSPKLERTPSSTTNNQTFTFSFWFKSSGVSADQYLYYVDATGSTDFLIYFRSDYKLGVGFLTAPQKYLITNRLLRDVSAWYHIVIAVDTTQATASNRIKMYINGVEETSFWYDERSSLPQNTNLDVNKTTVHRISGYGTSAYFDGYLAEWNFIDGQALTPSDFGESDLDSGVWKPKPYAGSYGTNGFYLKFANSGNMGEDSSGNDNTFTPTNLSGTTDVTTDTPTNNFCTMNPLYSYTGITFLEGNLQTNLGGANHRWGTGTFFNNSGKWYFECKVLSDNNLNSGPGVIKYGISDPITTEGGGAGATNYGWIYLCTSNGQIQNGGPTYGTAVAATTGDVLMVAYDLDNGKIWVGKNGTWNDGDPAAGTGAVLSNLTGGDFTPAISGYNENFSLNFGNPSFSITSGNTDDNGYGNFEYAPPSGFLALCTQNLATALSPTIDDGSQYFETTAYTGNASTLAITSLNFQPDFLWIKRRSSASTHALFNSNVGRDKSLGSESTDAEYTSPSDKDLISFDSNGFTVAQPSQRNVNGSGQTFVGWSWKANAGTTSSNTDGTKTTTVQASQTSGFSIVTYNGLTDGQTIGHGLGATPEMIIFKRRDAVGSWHVWHQGLGDGNNYILLNSTAAKQNDAYEYISNIGSSTVQLQGSSAFKNDTVGYFFRSVEGYSKFGSYTGNGSTDGTFVYTGFRPAFVMVKRTDTTADWHIDDAKRNTFNPTDARLDPNSSLAESSSIIMHDFTSNGFKTRTTSSDWNASGGTFIYMAFAENPFVTSGAVPVTAR